MTVDHQHTGGPPEWLADLRAAVTNARGDTAGPFFIERVPDPPFTFLPYRLRRSADGKFAVMTRNHEGLVFTAPARRSRRVRSRLFANR